MTFKIITLTAALEEKTINLFERTFHDSGNVNVDGATIHCWKHGGYGTQTYLEVVENYCNLVFWQDIYNELNDAYKIK